MAFRPGPTAILPSLNPKAFKPPPPELYSYPGTHQINTHLLHAITLLTLASGSPPEFSENGRRKHLTSKPYKQEALYHTTQALHLLSKLCIHNKISHCRHIPQKNTCLRQVYKDHQILLVGREEDNLKVPQRLDVNTGIPQLNLTPPSEEDTTDSPSGSLHGARKKPHDNLLSEFTKLQDPRYLQASLTDPLLPGQLPKDKQPIRIKDERTNHQLLRALHAPQYELYPPDFGLTPLNRLIGRTSSSPSTTVPSLLHKLHALHRAHKIHRTARKCTRLNIAHLTAKTHFYHSIALFFLGAYASASLGFTRAASLHNHQFWMIGNNWETLTRQEGESEECFENRGGEIELISGNMREGFGGDEEDVERLLGEWRCSCEEVEWVGLGLHLEDAVDENEGYCRRLWARLRFVGGDVGDWKREAERRVEGRPVMVGVGCPNPLRAK